MLRHIFFLYSHSGYFTYRKLFDNIISFGDSEDEE